jgi:hypothetical protein
VVGDGGLDGGTEEALVGPPGGRPRGRGGVMLMSYDYDILFLLSFASLHISFVIDIHIHAERTKYSYCLSFYTLVRISL